MKYAILIIILALSTPAMGATSTTTGPWGISVSGFSSFSSATASDSTAGKTIVIDKSVTVNNKTVTNRHIKVLKGFTITVNSGKTLVTPVPEAGLYQIYSGSGTIAFNSGLEIYPEWFGAVADAKTDGTGTDSTTALNKAFAAGYHATYGSTPVVLTGAYLFSNLTIPYVSNIRGQGIHKTALVAKTGSTGTAFTAPDGAQKIYLQGFAIYGRDQSYTKGLELGVGVTAYGTEGKIDDIWVRDFPSGFPGVNINGNVGEIGRIFAQSTGGVQIVGTANMVEQIESMQSRGFTVDGETVAVNFQDTNVGALEIEAPADATVPLVITGNTHISTLTISLSNGSIHPHLVTIGSSASTWKIDNFKLYFSSTNRLRNNSTAYVSGAMVQWSTDGSTGSGTTVWRCTTAGTTASSAPDITGKTVSDTVTDGTAVWTMTALSGTVPNTVTNGNFKTGSTYFAGNATSSSYTGEDNYASGQMISGTNFGIKHQQIQTFTLYLTNVAGTIKHGIYDAGINASPTFDTAISSAAASLTATPTGTDASTAFAAGGKITANSGKYYFIFDTATQIRDDVIGLAVITYNDSGTDLTVVPTVVSRDVNSVTRARLEFQFYNSTTGAQFDLSALGTGKTIRVMFFGFLKV